MSRNDWQKQEEFQPRGDRPAPHNPLAPEVHQFPEAARTQASLTGHQWRQRGTTVACTSCEMEHGFSVPPDQLLVGLDNEGMPIFMPIDIDE